VAGAFPRSQLAEVGLCHLQEHLLPPAWGFAPGSLPPIGASPDALIRHGTPPLLGGQPAAGALAPPRHDAAQQAGLTSEAPAATPSLPVGPWDIDGLLARIQLAGSTAPGAAHSGGGGSCGASPASSAAIPAAGGGWLVEVVEVKNTCPFGHSRRWAAAALLTAGSTSAASAALGLPTDDRRLARAPLPPCVGVDGCARQSLRWQTAGRVRRSPPSGFPSCSSTCCVRVSLQLWAAGSGGAWRCVACGSTVLPAAGWGCCEPAVSWL
jgi:hypothetical protein